MNNASTIRAFTLREGEKRTQLQKFAQTSDPPSVNRFHTFGCPVYTLDPNLQSGNAQPNKWTDRSKVGIFPGFSREHASTVSLVLNPITELTSPQFHVKHDDRFESTKYPIRHERSRKMAGSHPNSSGAKEEESTSTDSSEGASSTRAFSEGATQNQRTLPT